MEQWVPLVVQSAPERMHAHAALAGLPNTDEATFRAFFLASLRERHPDAACQTEWRRVDLLVQLNGRNVLIEFKYYVQRRTYELDGRPGFWKGGAGAQNEREFWECVEKLRTCKHQPIAGRWLVLVYEQETPPAARKMYEASYGSLKPDGRFADVHVLSTGPLVCKAMRLQ